MVKKEDRCYICETCGFAYIDKKKACECEDFCKKHKACNLEIIKYVVMKGGKNEKIKNFN